ncbi:MAG: VCBS repeat-containing protein [Gammaproteobacteria bacterium]|jgi:hypothetical protein
MDTRRMNRYTLIAVAGLLLGGCGGSGQFETTAVAFCGQDAMSGMTIGDFNGDGADDAAVGCRTRHDPLEGRAEIWLANESGGMTRVQSLPLGSFKTGGEGAGPITAADFNEDGHLDLVVTDTAGTTHGFSTLYGKGDGTFSQPTYFKQSEIKSVVSTDVNRDGHQDLLLLVNSFGSDATHYIPGNGGSINGEGPVRLVARDTRGYRNASGGDFNGDHRRDAVVPEPRHGRLHLFPSGGKAHDIVLGKAVRAIRRAMSGTDVDGDGAADLLVATSGSGDGHATRWVLTKGGPHLSDPVAAVPADAAGVDVADFNGDGVADLLVHQGYKPRLKYHGGAHPLILIGKAAGGYRKPVTLDLPGSPAREMPGDFNGDGRTDLLYKRLDRRQPQGMVYLSRW